MGKHNKNKSNVSHRSNKRREHINDNEYKTLFLKRTPKKTNKFEMIFLYGLEYCILFCLAVALGIINKIFILQVFTIPSHSMENTLRGGNVGVINDRIIAEKVTLWFSKPKKHDIIVFHDPDNWLDTEQKIQPYNDVFSKTLSYIGLLPKPNDGFLIKRVIGTAGDTIACCTTNGKLTINGKESDEKFVTTKSANTITNNPNAKVDNAPQHFSITVPVGMLWVMGDNRYNSADSLYHITDRHAGLVPVNYVVGKAIIICFPLNRFQIL